MVNTNGQKTFTKMLNLICNQRNKHFKRYQLCPVWERSPLRPTTKIQWWEMYGTTGTLGETKNWYTFSRD